jgi:hypothetical protein
MPTYTASRLQAAVSQLCFDRLTAPATQRLYLFMTLFSFEQTVASVAGMRWRIFRPTGGTSDAAVSPERLDQLSPASAATVAGSFSTDPTVSGNPLVVLGRMFDNAGPLSMARAGWRPPHPRYPVVVDASGALAFDSQATNDQLNTSILWSEGDMKTAHDRPIRGRRGIRLGYWHHRDEWTNAVESNFCERSPGTTEFRMMQLADWASSLPTQFLPGTKVSGATPATADAKTRYRLIAASLTDVGTRAKVTVRGYADAATRYRVIAPVWSFAQSRYRLVASANRDAQTRVSVQVRGLRDAASRLVLSARSMADAKTRLVLQSRTFRDAQTRLVVTARSLRDGATRYAVQARSYADAKTRMVLRVRAYIDAQGRYVLVVLNRRDASTRYRLIAPTWVMVGARFAVQTNNSVWKFAQTRYRITASAAKDAQLRLVLRARGYGDVPSRFKIEGRSYLNASTRARVTARGNADAKTRMVLGARTFVFAQTRAVVVMGGTALVQTRARFFGRAFRDAPTRFTTATNSVTRDATTRFVLGTDIGGSMPMFTQPRPIHDSAGTTSARTTR